MLALVVDAKVASACSVVSRLVVDDEVVSAFDEASALVDEAIDVVDSTSVLVGPALEGSCAAARRIGDSKSALNR